MYVEWTNLIFKPTLTCLGPDNVLDNDKIKVDFQPLYQCIHIYTTLDSLDELRKSYQADRMVLCHYSFFFSTINRFSMPKAQSDLILPSPLPLASFLSLTQEITGFFIIESHVLQTTGTFRSEAEVEELWDALVSRLSAGLQWALRSEVDPNEFLKVKECLIGFIMTLEVCLIPLGTWRKSTNSLVVIKSYSYSTNSLHSFILVLFEKYAMLLEKQFSRRFDEVRSLLIRSPISTHCYCRLPCKMTICQCSPRMPVNGMRFSVLYGWVRRSRPNWPSEFSRSLPQSRYSDTPFYRRSPLPLNLPWSQSFYLCCQDVCTSWHDIVYSGLSLYRYGVSYRSSINSLRVSLSTIATSISS